MAIIGNKVTEIGDVLLISLTAPIIGVVKLSSFTDIIIGETIDRYFKKEISYSTDGLFFTEWLLLTDELLSSLTFPKNLLYVNYRLTREGIDYTGELEFEEIKLLGEYEESSCQNYYVLPKSIFKDYFCYHPQQLGLTAKLTRDVFEEGILAKYLERNLTDNPSIDDKDFLDFWGTVCSFFGLVIIFSRQFLNMDEELLKEYLKQKGLYFSNSATLEELIVLRDDFYNEIVKRGTINIGTTGDAKNGELLRLIGFEKGDEFIMNVTRKQEVGWCIGKSSPMYKGLRKHLSINKSYENNGQFKDISLYPLFRPENCSVVEVDNLSCLQVKDIDGSTSGVGGTEQGKRILVDPNLSYEISFLVKQVTELTPITFAVNTFNRIGVRMNLVDFTGYENNMFFEKVKLNKLDTWYRVRGVIYSRNQTNLDNYNSKTNLGVGTNLRFNSFISHILPRVLVDTRGINQPLNETLFTDLQIKPLRTSYSTGFTLSSTLIQLWIKNRNETISQNKLENLIRDYLIPYNTTFKVHVIGVTSESKELKLFAKVKSKKDVTVFGSRDGSIEIESVGGYSPLRYFWSNGTKTKDVNNLSAGTYNVTIVDFRGDVFEIKGIQITQPSRPTAWRIKESSSYCELR